MKFRMLFFMLLAFSSIFANNLKLKSSAQIEKTNVYLSDLVELNSLDLSTRQEIAKILIMNIDKNVKFQNLSVQQINQILKKQNINKYFISGQLITIYPNNQIISTELIQSTVKDYLLKRFSIDELTEIELVKIPQIKIKDTNYQLFIKNNASQQLNGKMIIALQVKYPNMAPEEYPLNLKLYKTYTVYKLKNSKKMSERFVADDLELNYSRELISNQYNLSYEEILEKVAATYCPKGKILNTSDVKSEPLVRKTDFVVVNIIGKNFNMKYNAIAKNDAWLGEQVTLENPDTKRFFNAKVIDKNLVAIYLEGK
ncbi:MAG TPA: flagella basal body P-ring formation protein FlgA [Candidatus Cloacimonadota bacterium]|nr:flagella basal body P-ring formation protein FlgA [Candidatus Cloacimonadales bacterium]HPY96769.1 flagella basal body P-ring formation protein FlgA [Candidatus Cloacimonadota bacterium]HQB41366.1 flagella basal body P-ring formation protein FlgA [Candidatus Cloacimonadota bacterium]